MLVKELQIQNKGPFVNYEINFYESTQVAANPYWLWVRVYFPDERFERYIHDVCVSQSVVIYQTYDSLKAKLFLPATYVLVDRLDSLIRTFKQYFNPNNAIQYDITQDIQLTFATEKARNRFKKQFARQLENFLKKEEKQFKKIIEETQYY
jgi:hypothetical protein